MLDNIIKDNEEHIFKDYKENPYIRNKSINWYSRGYIGFKDSKEIKKFKYYFDENDPTNNPLYKITSYIFPNWESIIIIFFFCISFNIIYFPNKIFY